MYVAVETDDRRTVWADGTDGDSLGYANSSRVEIIKLASVVLEDGTMSEAKLMSGMWPDDDELRLLAVGVAPGDCAAGEYLDSIAPSWAPPPPPPGHYIGEAAVDHAATLLTRIKLGAEVLTELVGLMPVWGNHKTRAIHIKNGTPRYDPTSLHTEKVNQQELAMKFDEWRLQVDVALASKGDGTTDDLPMSVMKHAHSEGVTPTEFTKDAVPNIEQEFTDD